MAAEPPSDTASVIINSSNNDGKQEQSSKDFLPGRVCASFSVSPAQSSKYALDRASVLRLKSASAKKKASMVTNPKISTDAFNEEDENRHHEENDNEDQIKERMV